MHDVFISYSSAEMSQAETVRNVLEENGIPCWMAPRDIPGGSNYTKEIPTAIRGCQVFVLILSQNAQKSQWVLRELDSAVNSGKVILPFMLEDCALNDEFNFLLTGAQRYAAYQKKAEALETLVGRVKAVVAHGESVARTKKEAPQEPASQPEKQPRKQPTTYLGVERCPACNGGDLKPVKKLKRIDFAEQLMSLIPVVGLVVGWLAGVILAFIITMLLPSDVAYEVLLFAVPLAGAAAGPVFGVYLERKLIRRRRVRRHISLQTLQCCDCDKLFVPQNSDK